MSTMELEEVRSTCKKKSMCVYPLECESCPIEKDCLLLRFALTKSKILLGSTPKDWSDKDIKIIKNRGNEILKRRINEK